MNTAFVLLSGCGSRDGSEIHESVLCLLALDRLGFKIQCIAPDVRQAHTINHLTSENEKEPRRVIVEAARIARGKILSLDQVDASDADLLVMPGGLGASTTLSTYAVHNERGSVLPPVKNLIKTFFDSQKPICATCIAPVLIGLSLKGVANVRLTLGTDDQALATLERMGMTPVPCTVDQYVVDETHRITTTPAYMEPPSLADMWLGIEGAVRAAAQLVHHP